MKVGFALGFFLTKVFRLPNLLTETEDGNSRQVKRLLGSTWLPLTNLDIQDQTNHFQDF